MTERQADEVYEAFLDGKRDVGVVRGMGYAVLSMLATFGIGDAAGVPGDVVVRRKADGVEVLRYDAGDETLAPQALGELREQLASMTESEFRETNGLDA
jgi:hypothetical protein